MSSYGKYFLATEDDNITVNTSKNSTDFNNVSDKDNDDNDNTSPESNTDESNETNTDENKETTNNDTDNEEDDNTDFTDGIEDDSSGDTNDTGDEESGDSNDTEDDNTDFTDGVEDDSSGDTNDTGDDESSDNDGDNDGPGLDFSSTRTYILYTEFEQLVETINSIISTMEKYSTNSIEKGAVSTKVLNRFRRIKKLTTSYMLIRYPATSYIQNLTYYNKIVLACKYTIDMLTTINTIEDEN